NETSFSKNYISLEISGRDLADLSFVDLPGLIASVGQGGNVQDIELVKDLVVSYIEKPSCLILLTVACESSFRSPPDFENQGAHHLAKQFDPEGARTVGVLTKPDRIPRGEEESWARLLRNEREPLANNWYCVRQPSSDMVKQGIKWGEARRLEEEYFSRTQPWRSLNSLHKTFLGTGNLTERLSVILAELIAKRLPEIQKDLYEALQQTEKEISDLPPEPSSNPLGEMLKVVDEFKKELAQRIEGTPGEDGILQNIRPHTATFRRSIRATAPKFMPWERRDAHRHTPPQITFLLNEEEGNIKKFQDYEDEEEGNTETFQDYEDEDDGSDDNAVDDTSKTYGRDDGQSADGASELANVVCVDEVLQRAEMRVQSRTRELPDHYPFVVQKMYIAEFVQNWRKPTFHLFDAIYHILKTDISKVVHRHFARIGRGGAKQSVLMIMHEHLDKAATRSRERLDWLLQLESSPATFNTHYYFDYKNKFLAFYKACRHNENAAQKIWTTKQKGVNEAIAALSAIGIHVQPVDLPKLLPSDPMDPALNVMASVRAYFQVAYKRFVDEVPNAIDTEAVRGLINGLDQALRDGLQLTGADARDRCATMLQEPPSIATKRQELNVKLERLKDARIELMRLSV
ncbi:hypothetical protein ID866_10077, partial [Astraeus odoratus]